MGIIPDRFHTSALARNMISVSESILLHHPPSEAFAVVADPYQQLRWDTAALQSVEPLTPGPLSRGSRYLFRFNALGSVEYECTEYEPERRFAQQGSNVKGKIYHLFEFEAIPEGTLLTQTITLKLTLFGRILAPLLRRSLRRRLRTMNREITEYLPTYRPGKNIVKEKT